ncbi:methyltransferase-like protein 4 [Plasmopara halstedii]|uniref:Methyltransferase-like protein 4 n=1 Tax=Plasmopara halstedii TaxID=4781 RepID=A0A0P1ATB3_PLAHL|nr:methyltransferase-like protein 4 [Plasmopara halstedii]CEG45453.1 methyltransferase-like protein 4 [Plasmopara halstedii]|eukprot:XP_024581822.1 methyltransferase-like protein 4 [Plasmopara halstedii]
MNSKVSCVNHAALVSGYYMGKLLLKEDSLQIPSRAYTRQAIKFPPAYVTATAARRQRKRESAARRRSERQKELIAKGKYVPLNNIVYDALQTAFECYGGSRFLLRAFLPIFEDSNVRSNIHHTNLDSLPKMPESEILDDGNLHHNQTDFTKLATVNGTQVVLPARSSFVQQDVRKIHQLYLEKYKLIVMDPPWQNKSVCRGKCYEMLDHTELLKIDIPHIADLDECVLAVWVTSRPRYMTFLREQALPSWGFTFHACWYWLKLSKSGELVTPLDSTHRLPVEVLVVAYRAKDEKCEQRVRKRLGEKTRIVLSIPLRHSWKPPPETFFDNSIVSTTEKKVELFARELRPHWTSVGNEVLKFQAVELFQPAPSENE